MATENFSLTLPDNFVRLEPRKSVDGLSATEDTEVSHSPEGSLTSGTGVYCVRAYTVAIMMTVQIRNMRSIKRKT